MLIEDNMFQLEYENNGILAMKILPKISRLTYVYLVYENPIVTDVESYTTFQTVLRMRMCKFTKYVKQIFLKSCLWPFLSNLALIIDR